MQPIGLQVPNHFQTANRSVAPASQPIVPPQDEPYLTSEQLPYYIYIHSLLKNAGNEVLSVAPSSIPFPQKRAAWENLRYAVERLVYDENLITGFALDIDGETVLLMVHEQDSLKAGMRPFTPWYSRRNIGPRVSQAATGLLPIQTTYFFAIQERIAQRQDQTILLIDALQLEPQSLDPARDLKQAVLHLLRRGKIYAYAKGDVPMRVGIMVTDQDRHSPYTKKHCRPDWYSLDYYRDHTYDGTESTSQEEVEQQSSIKQIEADQTSTQPVTAEQAQKVLDWIQRKGLNEITLQKLRQFGPTALRSKDKILAAMQILENQGKVHPILATEQAKFHPKTKKWKIIQVNS